MRAYVCTTGLGVRANVRRVGECFRDVCTHGGSRGCGWVAGGWLPRRRIAGRSCCLGHIRSPPCRRPPRICKARTAVDHRPVRMPTRPVPLRRGRGEPTPHAASALHVRCTWCLRAGAKSASCKHSHTRAACTTCSVRQAPYDGAGSRCQASVYVRHRGFCERTGRTRARPTHRRCAAAVGKVTVAQKTRRSAPA